jgi:hypothetical protein
VGHGTGKFASPAADTLFGVTLNKGAELLDFQCSCSYDRVAHPLWFLNETGFFCGIHLDIIAAA